jgi:hypothetical protein
MPWPWHALALPAHALPAQALAAHALPTLALPWQHMPWPWHALAAHALAVASLALPWQHMPWLWHALAALAAHALAWAAHAFVDTGGKSSYFYSKVIFFDFPRYRPPFGECCVCSSISFPFRDTSCVCVGTCVRVCV